MSVRILSGLEKFQYYMDFGLNPGVSQLGQCHLLVITTDLAADESTSEGKGKLPSVGLARSRVMLLKWQSHKSF
jgi:hypothetical protein